MKIERPDPFKPGVVNAMEIDVTDAQLEEWANGGLIQNVMPHLSPDEREFIMTGITPEQWKKIFGET
jgi:hypothetical protein